MYENHDLARTIMDPCELPLDASLFSNYGPDDILSFLEFSHICGHEDFLS